MRLARALGVDGNPLRRASDRAEAWIRAGLLVAFLTVGPISALTAAQWTAHATGPSTSTVTSTQSHAVQSPSATAPAGRAVGVRGTQVWAEGRWESAGGSGQATVPPQRGGSAIATVLAAVLALTVTAFALQTVLRLIQWFLDWRRLAGWEAAWRVTGPQWTGHRSRGEQDD